MFHANQKTDDVIPRGKKNWTNWINDIQKEKFTRFMHIDLCTSYTDHNDKYIKIFMQSTLNLKCRKEHKPIKQRKKWNKFVHTC